MNKNRTKSIAIEKNKRNFLFYISMLTLLTALSFWIFSAPASAQTLYNSSKSNQAAPKPLFLNQGAKNATQSRGSSTTPYSFLNKQGTENLTTEERRLAYQEQNKAWSSQISQTNQLKKQRVLAEANALTQQKQAAMSGNTVPGITPANLNNNTAPAGKQVYKEQKKTQPTRLFNIFRR